MIELINGVKLPNLGLGATGLWDKTNHKQISAQYDIYCHAIESKKCFLYDTSAAYGLNESILGKAIEYYGNRKQIKIMSKLSNSEQKIGNIRKAVEESLDRLKTDYIDVYLLHWPQFHSFIQAYLEMEKLYEEGLIKAIGVCNFNKHHFEELMYYATITPMINQIEIHPLLTQETVKNYCYANDIQVVAYTPLARMHDVLFKSKPISILAKKYNKSPVQIILRWHYELRHIAIPRTLNKNHYNEMFDIEDFSLTKKDIAWISSINDNIRLRYNPDSCDFSKL